VIQSLRIGRTALKTPALRVAKVLHLARDRLPTAWPRTLEIRAAVHFDYFDFARRSPLPASFFQKPRTENKRLKLDCYGD
jgi:hypothetical protein